MVRIWNLHQMSWRMTVRLCWQLWGNVGPLWLGHQLKSDVILKLLYIVGPQSDFTIKLLIEFKWWSSFCMRLVRNHTSTRSCPRICWKASSVLLGFIPLDGLSNPPFMPTFCYYIPSRWGDEGCCFQFLISINTAAFERQAFETAGVMRMFNHTSLIYNPWRS